MRCPNCERFTSLEMSDPEVENLQIDDEGRIEGSVRIVRCCTDCGEEMKEATLELNADVPAEVVKKHTGKKHELDIEETGVDQIEEGGGRYAKAYFGASVSYAVKCSCQEKNAEAIHTGTMEDKIAASHMDEMV